jgi:hypothetical protein
MPGSASCSRASSGGSSHVAATWLVVIRTVPVVASRPNSSRPSTYYANAGMVMLGYGLYLLYSVLVAPVMIGMAARVFGGLHRPAAASVAAFGALSALARAGGILRWLTIMPALAAACAAAGPEQRAQIELVFNAVTLYGGGVCEVLGVSLFMALSLGTLCAAALRSGGMPGRLDVLGLASTALLAGLLLPVFGGPELVPVAAAVSLLSMWMLAAGGWALRRS